MNSYHLKLHLWPAGCAGGRLTQCCLSLVRVFELAVLSCLFGVNVHCASVTLSGSQSVSSGSPAAGSHQGFWSFWSHFNMTFIPWPWRVVSKACTTCSRGKRWVTNGFTFTFPAASMAMAIGQLRKTATQIFLLRQICCPLNKWWTSSSRKRTYKLNGVEL